MRLGANFICIIIAMGRATLESCFNTLLINLHGPEGPQLGNAMRWFEWFLLAILGAAVAVAPEATRAAESDNMLSLPKSREPDLTNAPDSNVIARHSADEPGALAPDLFMLSKGKVVAANVIPAQSQGHGLGPNEALKAAPHLTFLSEQIDGSKVISAATAKREAFTSDPRLPALQVATVPASATAIGSGSNPNGDLPPTRPALATAPQKEPGPAVNVAAADASSGGEAFPGASFKPAEPLRLTPRSAPHDSVMRNSRVDVRVATHFVPDVHLSAPSTTDDAQLAMASFLGPSFRSATSLKGDFRVRNFDTSETVLKTAALSGVLLTSAAPALGQPITDVDQPAPPPKITLLTTSPVRAAPIEMAQATPMIDTRSLILKPLLTAQPVVAAEVPEQTFQSASALRSAFQLASPDVTMATKRIGLPAAGELKFPPTPVADVSSASGPEAAPVMLMSMITAPPVPEEPSVETDLRSSGPRSSSNVSAPDPLWLRKSGAPDKAITVATATEKRPMPKSDAAVIDSLISWAERQNNADASDKDAASGGEVVVFELGSPSRRPEPRPVDPVMTALPKSPRDLREQLARPAPAGLGHVEVAAAEARPRLPDPSLLELVALADKSYVKTEIGMAILPLAPLDAGAPDDARDTIDTITLGDLVSRANYHSEDVRADRDGERSSRLAANSSLSQLGPRFDARFSKGHEHSFTSVGATPIDKPGHVRADGSTVIVQPLFDAVSIAGLARDQQLARGAQSRRRSTQVNVSFEAVTNYFDMLAARLALDLALKHQAQMNKLLDYMAKRAQLGGASEADFERVRAVTLSAKRAVIDARGELDAALSAMQRISGVTAVQIAVPDKLYLDIPEDADTAFTQMVRRNPELKTAFLQIKAAHEDAVAAAARAAPRVNLEMGRYQSQNASGAHGTTVDSRLMIVGSVSLGAGTEAFQAMSQSAHVSELKHRYASALRAAKERLRTVYLSRQNISDQRAVAWQEFASNTKVADAFDEQLFSANRSLIDVLDTYQKFYQSKLNIVRISVNQMKIGYQIKQIIGDLSQDNAGDEGTDVASVGSK